MRDNGLDRLACALRRLGGGFLDLDEGGDERRSGLGGQAGGFPLGVGDRRAELTELGLGPVDARGHAREQRCSARFAVADLFPGQRQFVACLDDCVADRIDVGTKGRRRFRQPVCAALCLADGNSGAFANLCRQPIDIVAQRYGSLGERSQGIVLRHRLGTQAVELGTRPPERIEEMGGAFVPLRSELGEALVDQHQAAVDLGDHPLRCAFLLRDFTRQAFERAVGMVHVRGEGFGQIRPGLADSG